MSVSIMKYFVDEAERMASSSCAGGLPRVVRLGPGQFASCIRLCKRCAHCAYCTFSRFTYLSTSGRSQTTLQNAITRIVNRHHNRVKCLVPIGPSLLTRVDGVLIQIEVHAKRHAAENSIISAKEMLSSVSNSSNAKQSVLKRDGRENKSQWHARSVL